MLLANPVTRRIAFLGTGVLLLLYLAVGVNFQLVALRINQLSIEVERRVQLIWPDTDEEKYCRAPHELERPREAIPNVVHFIMLGPHDTPVEITLAKYLALKATVLRMGASKIQLHTWNGRVADNEFWKELKSYISVVTLDAYQDLSGPHGLKLDDFVFAHQADILRLAILQREGGIYLDTDVFVMKPFTDLLSSPRDTVMGHEGGNRFGLCNAVIITRPDSPFIEKWQAEYEASFNPNQWNKHSVLVPKRLQTLYPDLVCPLSPTVFFWPTWAKAHVRYMYDPINSTEATEYQNTLDEFGGVMYENQLAFHAWGGHDQINTLTLHSMQTEDTRFNLLMRPIVRATL